MVNFGKFFVEQDMFGQPIAVNFKGSDVFKTQLGAVLSLATYGLILFNLVSLIQSFFNGSRQSESQRSEKYDLFFSDAVNLQENLVQLSLINFSGRDLYKMVRPRMTKLSEPGKGGVVYKKEEIVPLVECRGQQRKTIIDYWTVRGYNNVDSYELLCPDGQDLIIQGEGKSQDTQMIRIDYEYCFETNPLEDCLSEIEV